MNQRNWILILFLVSLCIPHVFTVQIKKKRELPEESSSSFKAPALKEIDSYLLSPKVKAAIINLFIMQMRVYYEAKFFQKDLDQLLFQTNKVKTKALDSFKYAIKITPNTMINKYFKLNDVLIEDYFYYAWDKLRLDLNEKTKHQILQRKMDSESLSLKMESILIHNNPPKPRSLETKYLGVNSRIIHLYIEEMQLENRLELLTPIFLGTKSELRAPELEFQEWLLTRAASTGGAVKLMDYTDWSKAFKEYIKLISYKYNQYDPTADVLTLDLNTLLGEPTASKDRDKRHHLF